MGSRKLTSTVDDNHSSAKSQSLPWWTNNDNLIGVGGGTKDRSKTVYSDPGYSESKTRKNIIASDTSVIVDDSGNEIEKKKRKEKKKVLWRQIRVMTLTESNVTSNDSANNKTSTKAAQIIITTASTPVSSVQSSTSSSKIFRPQYTGPQTLANYVIDPNRPLYIPAGGAAGRSVPAAGGAYPAPRVMAPVDRSSVSNNLSWYYPEPSTSRQYTM